MKKQLLFLMTLFWSVWSFGQSFTAGGILYNITSTSPATVEVGDNSFDSSNPFDDAIANIPSMVTNNFVVYTVTSIGANAFEDNSFLTSVTIPNSVTSIGNNAFNSTSLSNINIPNSITNIGTAVFANANLTNITIPNSVTSIGESAFEGNNLSSLIIPNSVTSIGDFAFAFNNLNSVTVNWTTPIVTGANSFGITSNIRLYAPIGTQTAYATASVWSGFNIAAAATHLNFDGINDNVTIPSDVSGAIAQGSEITIEYWFKGTNLQSAVRIQNGSDYIVAGWGGNNPQFIVSTDDGTNGVSNGTESVIEDNTWHHIACVWKKNEIFATYLDGVLQSSRVAANVNLPNLAGTEGKLGSLNGGSEFMTGNLDDVRIWNVARTAAQIAAAKNCELQGNESGLVAYYKFNQGIDTADNTSITSLTDATAAAANNGTLVGFAKTGTTSNFLSGSPITTGSVIPVAPSATAQTFCNGATVANLIPTTSSALKWYNSVTATTALATSTPLSNATYYLAAVNANGCESERTAVNVLVIKNPEPETTQSFCDSATVNDLQPAPSATITWYADANVTMALLATTALVDGTTYYVQATGGGCPPSPIVASTVSVTAATAPTNIGGEVTDNANKNLNVVITGMCSNYSGVFILDGQLNGKNKYLGNNNFRIGYDDLNFRWVLYTGNNITYNLFVLSTTSTDVFPPATGWIVTDCGSAVLSTMTTATINYNQNICKNSDASNLIPSPSDTIKWFLSATGSDDLASDDQVDAGIYYVASVNANGCESARTLVNIGFLTQPAKPIVAGTLAATSGITVSVTDGCSNFSGDYYYHYKDSNGKNVYKNETNNTRIHYDIEFSRWVAGVYVNNGVYGTDFTNATTSSSAFPPPTGWTAANNTCLGATLNIGFNPIERTFCQGATVAAIAGTDPSLKFYNSNGQNIALTDVLTSGIYAVVTVGANGCESDGTVIQITIETVAPPLPAVSSISFSSTQMDMSNNCPGTVALFNGIFNYSGKDANGRSKYVFADDALVELKYLGSPFNWVISKETNVLFTSNDTSTSNVPPVSGWTSTCGNVAVTLTVKDFAQTFCGNAQVNDLEATGTGTIKWYNVDTAGTALNSNDAIITGDYYVSQTNNNGCESTRVKVIVTVTSAPVTTPVTYSQNEVATALTATTGGTGLAWYTTPTGGTALTTAPTPSTSTAGNISYWVASTNTNGCESARTEIVVTVNASLSTNNYTVANNIRIYPNPTTHTVNIGVNDLTKASLAVYNSTGKLVKSVSLNNSSTAIDLQALPTGVYLFKITTAEGEAISKIVKQ